MCITHHGDVACPPGEYTNKHLFYAGIEEGRSCSPCSCGAASGVKCKLDVDLYLTPTCLGMPSHNIAIDACHGGGPFAGAIAKSAPAGGTCPTSGGFPQGGVAPGDPTTVCCAAKQP
jgi:hypothetical protein